MTCSLECLTETERLGRASQYLGGYSEVSWPARTVLCISPLRVHIVSQDMAWCSLVSQPRYGLSLVRSAWHWHTMLLSSVPAKLFRVSSDSASSWHCTAWDCGAFRNVVNWAHIWNILKLTFNMWVRKYVFFHKRAAETLLTVDSVTKILRVNRADIYDSENCWLCINSE